MPGAGWVEQTVTPTDWAELDQNWPAGGLDAITDWVIFGGIVLPVLPMADWAEWSPTPGSFTEWVVTPHTWTEVPVAS